MKALTQNAGTIIIALVIMAGLYIYNSFFHTEVVAVGPSATTIGADLIRVADNISKATLSRDLFSTSGYRLLSDFSTPLQPQAVGRPNPFAPVGQ